MEKQTCGQIEKEGEWNLHVRKDRPTRWHYFMKNPQGGGGGMGSYKSIKSAIAAGLHTNFNGAKRVWVIISKWDGPEGDYFVTKAYWLTLK
jgi:hypothetical protein